MTNRFSDENVIIERVDPSEPEARRLLESSDRLMASLYPPQSNHMESVTALQQPNAAFFGCRLGGRMVGCGAVKVWDEPERYGEIKRLFVDQSYRGRGLSRALMARLERHLAVLGIETARLEVGVSQPEAISLYRSLGYEERPPFGPYSEDPLSVFMEKALGGGDPRGPGAHAPS